MDIQLFKRFINRKMYIVVRIDGIELYKQYYKDIPVKNPILNKKHMEEIITNLEAMTFDERIKFKNTICEFFEISPQKLNYHIIKYYAWQKANEVKIEYKDSTEEIDTSLNWDALTEQQKEKYMNENVVEDGIDELVNGFVTVPKKFWNEKYFDTIIYLCSKNTQEEAKKRIISYNTKMKKLTENDKEFNKLFI